MRVNVCYSADMEELPSIVLKLCAEVADNLRNIADNLDHGVSEQLSGGLTRSPEDLQQTDQIVQLCRMAFGNIDTRLQDIQMINGGAADVFKNPEQYEAELARRQAAAQAAKQEPPVVDEAKEVEELSPVVVEESEEP